ncbi:hypothetical protein [Streptomyces maremycinicus]|uniref:hypothetical protein n=1 Tax=Streptomyces maremycinicus TaxID=1679753 RepID=UPI000786A38D|nr:hypothetical protein [Streptomyces sp. NBRC 110468]
MGRSRPRQLRLPRRFPPASLHGIEPFISDHSNQGTAAEGGLLTAHPATRLFALGCYLGQTPQHALGGSREADDDCPHSATDIRLRLPDGPILWPVQRMTKRYRNDPEDSITAYTAILRLNTSRQPQATTKRRIRIRIRMLRRH